MLTMDNFFFFKTMEIWGMKSIYIYPFKSYVVLAIYVFFFIKTYGNISLDLSFFLFFYPMY